MSDTTEVRVETGGSPEVSDEQLIAMLVDRARSEGLQLTGEGGLLQQLTKRVLESALEGEVTDHLGYDKHDQAGRNSGNSRNGTRSKTVITDVGPVQVKVPRDTAGTFEPQIVAVFGRWRKHEELLDIDDAAAGHIVRFCRSPNSRIVRSRRPAHPAIVSVADFTEAQLLRRKRAGTSNRSRAKLERVRFAPHLYLLAGRVRCDVCGRRMQGETVHERPYYRCRAKTIAPGSALLAEHPPTVNLREDMLVSPIDSWLSGLFDREHRDDTIATLVAAQPVEDTDTHRATLRLRITKAEEKLAHHLAAIEAGVDPKALVAAMNTAQAEKAAAEVELTTLPRIQVLSATEIRKLVESLGDIKAVLTAAAPADKAELYRTLELDVRYHHDKRCAIVGATLCGVSTRVRRGTHPLTTRIDLRK